MAASSSSSQQPEEEVLRPTYVGFIESTIDALMVAEAIRRGQLHVISGRPTSKGNLVVSGAVYVYEEGATGIKRWTDGVSWSPSRILNNFLIYRQTVKDVPASQRKKAKKPKANENNNNTGPAPVPFPELKAMFGNGWPDDAWNIYVRRLVGSLIESYDFEPNGLVKKTVSINWGSKQYHLVSYYSLRDVMAGNLMQPIWDPDFDHFMPKGDLIDAQKFRAPIDQHDMQWIEDRSAYLTTLGYHVERLCFDHWGPGQAAFLEPVPQPQQHMAFAPIPMYTDGLQHQFEGEQVMVAMNNMMFFPDHSWNGQPPMPQ